MKPDDPDAKVKFLAAEALRGVGGIVLDANGLRFCNELGRRDYVTGATRFAQSVRSLREAFSQALRRCGRTSHPSGCA